MCVCVLKRDDIFIDCSSWSVVESIVLPKPWFECGLSSNQVRTNDIRNVVLLVVDSSSIHHYILWVWPMLSPCSLNYGIPFIWKPGWIVVEPISNIFICSINRVEHLASIGNFYKHYLHNLLMKHMTGRKKWFPLTHVHLMQVVAMTSRKSMLLPLESFQISHAYMRSILWFGDLQPPFYMYP